MRVNLKGVPVNGNFEVLPAGLYEVQLTGYTPQTARDSGNEYMKCEYVIVDGEYEGRKLWDNIVFTPTALWKLKALALAVSFSDVNNPEGIETEELFTHALGVKITVKVIIEKYRKNNNDQQSNKIESYVFLDSNTPDVFPAEDDPFK